MEGLKGVPESHAQEIETLQAIFMESITILPVVDGRAVVRFSLLPNLASTGEENFVAAALIVRLPPVYPNELPEVVVEKIKGLSLSQLASLQKRVEQKAVELKGEDMLFALANLVQDALRDFNVKPMSVYDEMLMRQKAEELAQIQARARKEQEAQDRETAAREALEQRIQQELRKRSDGSDRVGYDLFGVEDFPSAKDLKEKDRIKPVARISSIPSMPSMSPDVPPAAALHPQKPFRWKKLERIGKGVGGEMYLAHNLTTREKFIVKEIVMTHSRRDQLSAAELHELETLKGLSHPNIVKYMGVDRDDTYVYLFMDNAGRPITTICPLKEEDIVRKYARQMLLGLTYLHANGIVHRSLRCGNIFVHSNGHLLLTDYGFRFLLGDDVSTRAPPTLTPHSMAPRLDDEREDSWRAGLCVMEMITGNSVSTSSSAADTDSSNSGQGRDSYAQTLLKSLPKSLPKDARDFINVCFKSGKELPVAIQLLEHPFIADISSSVHDFLHNNSPPRMSGLTQLLNNKKGGPLEASNTDSDKTDVSSQHHREAQEQRQPFYSRYKADFEEVAFLGRGGFGEVVKVRKMIDNLFYAVKKIRLNPEDQANNAKMLREVTTLARLHHEHVVRYYNAWLEGVSEADLSLAEEEEEDDDGDGPEEEDWLRSRSQSTSMLGGEKSGGRRGGFMTMSDDEDDEGDKERSDEVEAVEAETAVVARPKKDSNSREWQVLYIQMEYCDNKTLREMIDLGLIEEDATWEILRQIIEGLNHIHAQGIIHRDLKPANVFIDANNNVKIGDFGLATTGGGRTEVNLRASVVNLKSSLQGLTTGVGTPFYISPEQLKTGKYDQKVDIFSLGIIFFEVCQPFTTGMERAEALRDIRAGKFPEGFTQKKQKESEVIRWLLKEDPNERPTTGELLKSDLLPSQVEYEIMKEAIRTIITPDTTIFADLMDRLFQNSSDEHLDFTYDTNTAKPVVGLLEAKTFEAAVKIFRRHGATQLDTPLLFPKSQQIALPNSTFSVLDHTGLVLALPFDLTLPFARYVAHNNVQQLKRYSIAKVYRKNPIGAGHPRELYECDYDIVSSPNMRTVHDAEVIKVVSEVLDEFSFALGPCFIRINHSRMLESIAELNELADRKKRNKVLTLIGQYSRYNWHHLARELLSENLSSKSTESIKHFVHTKGDLGDNLFEKLDALCKGKPRLTDVVSELRMLAMYLKAFGVQQRVVFDPTLVYNHAYYEGLIFQAIREVPEGELEASQELSSSAPRQPLDIIAAGGRYDSLIMRLQRPNSRVNIAIEKIVSIVFKAEQVKTASRRSASQRDLWMPDTEVLIISTGTIKNMLEERMTVAAELWAKTLRVEYLYPDRMTPDEIAAEALAAGIPWVVVLKDRSLQSGTVKVKNIAKKTDIDLQRGMLPDYLFNVLRKTERGVTPFEVPHAPPPEPRTAPSINVQILESDRGSKQKRTIEKAAQTKIMPVIRSFLSSSGGIKVLAINLPYIVARDVASGYDPKAPETSAAVLARNSRHKGKLQEVFAWLATCRAQPVFIYCYKEENYVMITT